MTGTVNVVEIVDVVGGGLGVGVYVLGFFVGGCIGSKGPVDTSCEDFSSALRY